MLSISGIPVSGTVKVIQGKSIVVKCQTSVNLSSTYAWSNNVSGQNLRLNSVNLSDEKSYTCTVTSTIVPSQNNKASAYLSFALDVLCK